MHVATRIGQTAGIRKFPSALLELFIGDEFLPPDLCSRIMTLMDKQRRPSTIADDLGDKYFRTSETCNLDSAHPDVADLEARIVALTGLDPLKGEPLQGQRYDVGQEFKPHTDYFEPEGADYATYCAVAGQRTWTVMIYLNEPEGGGITRFVQIDEDVRPEVGKLLAWNNMDTDGRPNFNTLHHGMKVEGGTKYIVTKWFRENHWVPPKPVPAPAPKVARAPEVIFSSGNAASILAGGNSSDKPWMLGGSAGVLVRDTRPSEAKVSPQPPAATIRTAEKVALERREWILSLTEKQRRLDPEAREVPRVRNLSSEDFLAQYYAPGRPVIIEGELDDWPALSRWTSDYLKAKVGPSEIEYQGQRVPNPEFELQKDKHKSRMPFDAFLEMISSAGGNNAYMTAYNDIENRSALAPLYEDVRPLSKFLKGAPGMIWVGPLGTFTPLHFDLTNNMLAQVAGAKRFVLLPPSETRYLYNYRHVFSAVQDIMDDDAIARYPLAAEAFTFEVELGAGDLLYIPIGWWHQVTALDFSVTFTFTDFLWQNSFFHSFPED